MKPFDLESVVKACSSAARGSALPVGVAVGPHAANILARERKSPRIGWIESMFDPLPMLIDPRLPLDRNEVYYDRDLWRERVKEQQRWDAAGSGEEAQNVPVSDTAP